MLNGSCDTKLNLRDPTKAPKGSQNIKLCVWLQNNNSEPKSLAPAPKKKFRAKKLGSGSKKNLRLDLLWISEPVTQMYNYLFYLCY